MPPATKRLALRRLLLAVALGLAVWCGVGWWLAPRPLYTLRFDDPARVAEKPWNEFPQRLSFQVAPFDRSGKWFVLQRPHEPDRTAATVDFLEYATGKTVASHVLRHVDGNGYRFDGSNFPMWWSFSMHADPDGTVYDNMAEENAGLPAQEARHAVYAWNPFTGQKRLAKAFAPTARLQFSADGTAVLERTRLSPLLGLLIPPTPALSRAAAVLVTTHHDGVRSNVREQEYLQAIISGTAQEDLGLELYRVWSLPDFRPLSSFAIGPPYTFSSSTLSHNGRWLTLGDQKVSGGMTTPQGVEVREYVMPSAIYTDRGHHVRSPCTVLVYDTHTGLPWHSLTGYPGFLYLYGNSQSRQLVRFEHRVTEADLTAAKAAGAVGPIREQLASWCWKTRVLHLPSKTWVYGDNLAGEIVEARRSPPHDRLRWAAASFHTDSRIFDTDALGHTQQIATAPGQITLLSASGSQCLTLVNAPRRHLPTWLNDWLQDYPRVLSWLGVNAEKEKCLAFYDYAHAHTLWSTPSFPELERTTEVLMSPTGDHVIVHQKANGQHHVTVSAFPMPVWSPWWSRTAGLLAHALTLLARRRRPATLPAE